MNSTDRLPPSAPESELAILGCCLFEPHLARGLHPAWFYNREAQILAGHLRALVDKGEVFDRVSVIPELRELGIAEPVMFTSRCVEEAIGPSFFKVHAKKLADMARKRRLLEITATSTSEALSAITEGNDILASIESAARRIREELPEEHEEQGLAEILTDLTHEYEAASLGQGPRGVSTGFHRLDRLLGPMLPGQLHILAARPSVGKTSLALGIADHVALALGKPVGVVSLEMPRSDLAHRLLCAKARVDGAALRRGEVLDERALSRLSAASVVLGRAPIHIRDDEAGLSAVSGIARQWRMDRGIELLMIDYLGLLKSGEPHRPRYEETTLVSNAMKRLALQLEIPILCLCQLNRASETEERPPRLSDLRDSGAIEQDADTVMLLHSQEGEGVHVIIGKNRSGPVGRVTLQFEGFCTRFYEA